MRSIFVLVLAKAYYAVIAFSSDTVKDLPGYGPPMQRTLAGHVLVNSTTNGHLFYMFFEKLGASDPTTPFLVWLNGGPGASSSLGNLLEHGPYRLQVNGSLTPNPSTWNKLAHILYFDQPVGTGYSYCNTGGYVTNNGDLAEQFATGLAGFFDLHPEYRKNPFYMTGESYAGVYVPAISAHIIKAVPQIKLAGVLIGNPGNFHYTQYNGQIEFAQSHGLIGDDEAAEATQMWQKCVELVDNKDMVAAFLQCEAMSSYIFDRAGNPFLYNIAQWGDPIDNTLFPVMQKYFADPTTRAALHAGDHAWKNGDGTVTPNPVVTALNKTLMDSVLPDLQTILEHKVPLRVYDGVLDGSSCNHISVYNSIKLLQWSGKDAFTGAKREKWSVQGTGHPAGYIRRGGGLTFVWVANSGHLVPTDQPEAALEMLRQFLAETSPKRASLQIV